MNKFLCLLMIAVCALPMFAGTSKSLGTVSTTPVAVTVQGVCDTVTVKEDESVGSYPTVGLVIQKPAATNDAIKLTAGKSYTFRAPVGGHFASGQIVGYVSVRTGSTTLVQDEN